MKRKIKLKTGKYFISVDLAKKPVYYYHSTIASKVSLIKMKPIGLYERVKEDGDCPQPIFDDINNGFPNSNIAESCFSKSISGSILGGARQFPASKKYNQYKIDIYRTQETPDIDISHCTLFDFSILDEVRYRREISVEKFLTITISPILIHNINECYGEESNTEGYSEYFKELNEEIKESYGLSLDKWDEKLKEAFPEDYERSLEETETEPRFNDTALLSIKETIEKQLKEGKNHILSLKELIP